MTKKPPQQQTQQYNQNQNQYQPNNYKNTPNNQTHNNNNIHHPQQLIKKWHRLTNYNIQNRVYRLIDDHDQNQSITSIDTNLLNTNNQNDQDNQLDRDFRQPKTKRNTNSTITSADNSRQRKQTNSSISSSLFKRRPRQISNSPSNNTLKSTNIFGSISTLFHHIHSIQLPTLLSYLPFLHQKPTLYSQYKHKSLAILNNSIDLEEAIIKALEYNIPLMQIVMKINQANQNNKLGQSSIVWQRILNNFTIAHFINQNFVLYGDWQYQKYKDVFYHNHRDSDFYQHSSDVSNNQGSRYKQRQSGRILFRRGSLVFGEIDIEGLCNVSQQELIQILQKMRNRYYQLLRINKHKQSLKQDRKQHIYNQYISDHSQQSQEQKNQQPLSADRIKSIEQQILNDYLQEKKLQQQQLQMQKDDINKRDNYNNVKNYQEDQDYSSQSQNYSYQQQHQTHNHTINENNPIKFNSPNLLINSRKNNIHSSNQKSQQNINQQNYQNNHLEEKPQYMDYQHNPPKEQDLQ